MNIALLSKEERREMAAAIDYILDFMFHVPVIKAAEGDLFGPGAKLDATEEIIWNVEKNLTNVLLQGWDKQARKAIKKGVAILECFGGDIKEDEVNLALNAIAKEMGPNFKALTQEQVADMVGTAYLLGRRVTGAQIGIKPELGLIDEQARQWLADHTVFWIGDYYDAQLGKTIAEEVRHLALEQGLGREEVGRQLKALLGDKFAKSDAYWRGLAATTVDRARNFGGVQSMIEAQVETYEILPVGDERTCPVCMTMAKHTFKIEHAVQLRDAVLNAKNPEDIKKIHPWLPFDEVKNLDTKGAVQKGLALPPYHYHCRCTYIVSTFSDITVSHEPLDIKYEPVKAKSEIPPMENLEYAGSGGFLGGAGEKHIYVDSKGGQYIFKPAQSKSGKPEPFRAYVQEAASQIASKIYEPGDFIEIKLVTDKKGRIGTLQKLYSNVEGDLKKINWEDLTSEQWKQIQREHVLDWVIGNFDSHGGNFILADGKILGVDKEQAFRYMNDPKSWKMSLDYHPNAVYGEQEPIYNTIYRAFAKKDVDLDLQTVLPTLQRLEAIPDEEYKNILRPYAEALYGKGGKADTFLAAAVKRKHEAREQFRQFYTELLKARDPKFKGTFKFADEMTGAELTKAPLAAQVMTKEELSQLNTKALKDMAKAKKIKYFQNMTKDELVEALADPDKAERISIAVKERVRAKIEAARKTPPLPKLKPPENADIMQDFEQVPKTPLGLAVRKDGKKIEGQVITIRRIEDDGRPGFQLTMKIPQDYHGDIEKALREIGAGHGDFIFQPGRLEHKRGVYRMSRGKGVNVGRAWYYSDQDATVYFAGTARERALMGQLEVRVYDADGVKAAKKAQEIMKKLKLEAAIADPTPEDERLLRLSRLAWQHAPREEYNIPLEKRTTKQMEQLLKSKGIDPTRADKLVEKEVWPGYKTFVEEGISKEYKKAGADYLFAGIGNSPKTVVEIFSPDSPGLMSTLQRYHNGILKGGASPTDDIMSGGADSAFVRLVPKNARGYCSFKAHYKGAGYRIHVDIKELERTDWYAYDNDNYGGTGKDRDFDKRMSAKEFISSLNNHYTISNEVMFRKGIRKESITCISCDDDKLRTNLIEEFKKAGITEINGKKVENFVIKQEII